MILVVDDHQDTRVVLIRLLKMEGYESLGVTCGAEALLFLKGRKPCLVLLDYNMPDMNGLEVLREMKRSPRHADVPVIMFSASSGSVKESALRAGVDAYVVKGSLDWPQLRAEIVRLVGAGPCARGATRNPPDVPPHARKVGA